MPFAMNNTFHPPGPRETSADNQKAERLYVLNCQITACQQKMDAAVTQVDFAQSVLAEARDQLEVAHQALEQVIAESLIATLPSR